MQTLFNFQVYVWDNKISKINEMLEKYFEEKQSNYGMISGFTNLQK